MIELGRILIDDKISMVEARNKIRLLAADLKFDSIEATKLATITSDLSRTIYQKGEESSIVVGFDKKEKVFGLILIFQSKKEELNIGKAEIFFDSLCTSRTKEGFQRIETFIHIPDPEFKPTEEFISTEKEKLIRFSRVELLSEVKRKNEELSKLLDERKLIEEALRKSRDEMEERVAQRTKELAQANIRLQEADRLKSVFLASMSHELRTPLNSIIGFTGIILQGMSGELNEEQKKQLTMVKNSANHLLSLINDLLDISKIEAGKIELLIEEFDLSALVQEVKDSFKVATEEKDLKMSLKMPKRLVIKSDERRTKQVLMNLVSNAVKFTDEGKIEIKLAKKDKEVEISVRDTGMGIRKEKMDRLFQPFTQMSSRARPKQEGTGLGLYLSKKIVDLLSGEIKTESEFGQGSVFTFTLPLKYQGTKE